MADQSAITKARHIADDEGVFQLSGYDATWIWVHTCPTPKCSCRSALIVSTNDGRAALLERGAPVLCGNWIEVHSRRPAVEVEQSAEPFASLDPTVRVRRDRRALDQRVPEALMVPFEPVVAHEL